MEAPRSYCGPPVDLSRPRGFSSFLSTRNYRLGGGSKWPPPSRSTPPTWRPLRCAASALPLDVSPPPIDGDPVCALCFFHIFTRILLWYSAPETRQMHECDTFIA
ncbi:hypothetical protein B296_00022594 [Ensete ventricosum]|uniref:Uncharacterized protein n=1 Tax=Ensete ventricosum TaxID=4639 RepID=A0A426Y1B4_ENSVE|nr:hypothetical protein B296_00022594 [Ensete ventricosum]